MYLPVHGPSQLQVMLIAVLQSAHSAVAGHPYCTYLFSYTTPLLNLQPNSAALQCAWTWWEECRYVCNTSMWGETGLEVKPFLRLCICCLAMERLEHVHMYTHTRDSVTNTHPCCEQASHILTQHTACIHVLKEGGPSQKTIPNIVPFPLQHILPHMGTLTEDCKVTGPLAEM